MRTRHQFFWVGGLFFLFLLLASGQIFYKLRVPFPSPKTAPKSQLAPVVLGVTKARPALENSPPTLPSGKEKPGGSEKKTTEADDKKNEAGGGTTSGENSSAPTATPTGTLSVPTATLSVVPTPTLTLAQQQVSTQVTLLSNSLNTGDYEAFSQRLAQELRQSLTATAFPELASASAAITRLELQAPPQIDDDWATTWVKAFSTGRELGTYRAVFHREDGGWYLFGTDQP